MRQFDIHGDKINYDAPGQLGAGTQKPEKLKRRPLLFEKLDALVDYRNGRGEQEWPLHIRVDQLREIMKVPKDATYKPTGNETYRGHPLVIVDD